MSIGRRVAHRRPARFLGFGGYKRQPIDPKTQHLLDLGILHRQTFSPEMYQLALESGEDPNDPNSILFAGTPSDAASYQEHEQPGEHDTAPAYKKAKKRKRAGLDGSPYEEGRRRRR